jgi:sensor c-di-GMP phosphodiesterase-like protein
MAGVLLLGLPAAVFNFWLNGMVERQAQEELDLAARRTIALTESRISRTIAILDELASRGVSSCEPAHLDALRQATFATAPVKELSVIASNGNTLCSSLGGMLERREVIASELMVKNGIVDLEVIRIGDNPGQIIRIKRWGGSKTNALAALISAELFVPQVSTHGGPVTAHALITTSGGTVVGQNGVLAQAANNENDYLTASLHSDHYALNATLSLPRASMVANQNDLRILGTIITGGFALIVFAFLLLLPKGETANPIVVIEKALKAGEFVPYYQPVVDIASGRLRGAEVLVRWRKPDGTIILPAAFIPLAESSGLILELTRALMRRVCKETADVLASRPQIKIGFNLSARHLADDEIVRDVSEIFKNSPLRLSQVVLEVTERQPLENLTEARRVIAALQGLGVWVAIDDVGTGHGGLSYILKLGVDMIKIDKMFVDSIGVDRNSNAIVETLVELAKNMRMEVVAEGVENFEQIAHLRNLGIQAAQGYVFAPPMPASSFLQLVEAIDPLPKQGGEEQMAAMPADTGRRAHSA